MFNSAVLKAVTALLVSATMAFPGQLWAKDGSSPSPADATEGVPVLFEQATLPDGSIATVAMAPVSREQEPDVVGGIALSNPNGLMLGVSGPDDPVLAAVERAGKLASVETHVLASDEEAPILKSDSVPLTFKQKLADKMKAITNFCKREKFGLLTAFYVSSLGTGYVMYESSSVSPGLEAMVGLLGWAVFQGVFTHSWEKYLRRGGEFLRDSLSKVYGLFGRELSSAEKRLYEVSGTFYASWGANSAVDAYTFFTAGTLDSLAQVVWYGFLSANDILDAVIAQKVFSGALTPRFFKNFVVFRILAGPIFDVAAWLNVPHIQLVLASLTAAGLTYLAVGNHIERKVVPKVVNAHATASLRCSALLSRRPKKGETI